MLVGSIAACVAACVATCAAAYVAARVAAHVASFLALPLVLHGRSRCEVISFAKVVIEKMYILFERVQDLIGGIGCILSLDATE